MQVLEVNSAQVLAIHLKDVETEVRALLNEPMGIIWTAERLRPFIKMAMDRVPFLAAAMAGLSQVGDTENVRLLMQWGMPAKMVAPLVVVRRKERKILNARKK